MAATLEEGFDGSLRGFESKPEVTRYGCENRVPVYASSLPRGV